MRQGGKQDSGFAIIVRVHRLESNRRLDNQASATESRGGDHVVGFFPATSCGWRLTAVVVVVVCVGAQSTLMVPFDLDYFVIMFWRFSVRL